MSTIIDTTFNSTNVATSLGGHKRRDAVRADDGQPQVRVVQRRQGQQGAAYTGEMVPHVNPLSGKVTFL